MCAGSEISFDEIIAGGTWSITNSNATFAISGLSATITGMLPGLDTLIYTVSNACGTASTSEPLSINALPYIGTISGPTAICVGSLAVFTATDSGGIWGTYYAYAQVDSVSTLTATIGGVNAGTDSVYYTITDTNGCSVTATTYINIDSLPNSGIISGANNEYVGSSITLTNTVTGGIWSTTNTSVSTVSGAGLVYGIALGIDSIIYTANNACGTASTYFPFTVEAVSMGINNVATSGINALSVNPNPTAAQFTINVSSSFDEQATITITNMVGEKMKEITGNTNKPINASLDVPAGVYLLNATTAHGNVGGKIVIE